MSISNALARGRKLDDWLSPILVKELRQGMRARVFVLSFLLLQVCLFVLVVGNVVAQEDRPTLQVQNHFFWVIVGFVLLILMPLRGLVAVSAEVRNRTMETIMLTRLTAWRVIFGKWSALFAQSLLFVSAVLPYVVLRYFLGGNDVVSDFVWIILMLWLSGILIAGSIAVSGMSSAIVRILVLIAGISVVSTVIGVVGSSTLSHYEPLEVIGWMLIYGLFIPGLLFELTASGIAPASENHAIRHRLLAVLFLVLACALQVVTTDYLPIAVGVPLVILIGICFFELAEKPRLLPRMVESFSRRGFAGKVAALLLLPGWPSGLLFTLVVVPLTFGVAYQFMMPLSDIPAWFLITSTLGSVLPPVLICHLFWPKNSQVLLMIVLYNLLLLAFAGATEGTALILANTGGHLPTNPILAFMPGLPVQMVVQNSDPTALAKFGAFFAVGNGFVDGLLLVALFLGSRKYYNELLPLLGSPARVAKPGQEAT